MTLSIITKRLNINKYRDTNTHNTKMAIKITCINKDAGYHQNPHKAIRGLGWTNDITGQVGWSTRLQMYDFVIKGGEAYVSSGLTRARLMVAIHEGTRYVKTIADETKRDNLLYLPECLGR